MSEFKAIETQEEFDARISERLKREKEKYETQFGDLNAQIESLKLEIGQKEKALEDGKTGVESLNKTIEELNGKVSAYEIANLKTSIALKNGIPYDLASRLTGTNEQELTQDAIKLAEFISRPNVVAPLKTSEPKGSQFEGKEAALLAMSKNLTNKGE